jgi:hypothetical protein
MSKTDKKWYSDGLKDEEAKKLEKRYAKIENPVYGLTDRDFLALQFSLSYEDRGCTNWALIDQKDIKELFTRTGTSETSQLEGKVIEAFIQGQTLRGISVNPNLV